MSAFIFMSLVFGLAFGLTSLLNKLTGADKPEYTFPQTDEQAKLAQVVADNWLLYSFGQLSDTEIEALQERGEA